MASDAELKFVIKADAAQARNELGQFSKKVKEDVAATEDATKKVGAGGILSLSEQTRAAESLQRQRSSAILSVMRAMEGDVGKSATQTQKNASLTDKLIADSQRAIVQAERSAAGAGQAIENAGKKLAVAEREAASFGGSLSGIAATALPVGLAIGAVATAAVGAGTALFGLIKHASDVGSELFDLSKKTGLNAESLSALKLAAEQSGSSIGEASQAVVLFQKKLTEAAQGGESARKLFNRVGIDIAADLADPNKAVRDLSRVLNGDMPAGFNRTTLATELMGRAGANLVSTFETIGGSFDEFLERAHSLGVILTEQDLKAADDFGDTLGLLGTQAEALGNKFALGLAPSITRALEDVSVAMERHRAGVKVILDGLGNVVEDYASKWSLVIAIIDRLAGGTPGTKTVIPGGGLDAPFEVPQGMSAEDAIHLRNLKLQELGLENPENKPFSPQPGAPGALEASEAEKKKAAVEAAKARGELVKAAALEADAAYETAKRKAADTFRETGDLIDLIGSLKKAEEERWKARQAQFVAEREQIGKREQAEELTAAELNVKRQEEKKAAAEFRYRMVQLDAELTEKNIAEMQKRHARELELYDLRAKEYIEKQKALAQAEVTTYEEAQRRITEELKTGFDKRRELLEAEKELATGNAEKVADYNHQLAVLTEQAAAFRREAGGAAVSATIDDLDRTIKKVDALLAEIDRMRAAFNETDVPIVGVDLSKMPKNVLKGPWVNPNETPETPPPPNFDPWRSAITGLKDLAVGSFKGIGQAFAQMVGSFAAGAGASGQSFKSIARAAISSFTSMAVVQALMELAYGFAALTPWGAAIYGPAPAHFKAAALLGAAAAAGAGIGALVGGGGSTSGSAFSGSSGGSSFGGGFGSSPNQDSGPRVIEQSRNTVIEHVHIIRLEPGLVVQHVEQDIRANGRLRGLVIETAAA